MEKIIADVFMYFLEMIISFIFISYNYEKKQSIIKTLLSGFALFFVGAMVFRFIDNEIVNIITCLLINIVFFYLCFAIDIKFSVIFSIILNVFMVCSEIITIYIASYLLKIPTNAHKNNVTLFIILGTINKTIYFAFSQLFAFAIKRLRFKSNHSLRFLPLFMFPIISVAISALFFKMSFIGNYPDKYNMLFSIFSILMIISSIYIFVYYQMLTNKDEELKELQTEKALNEINNNYLEIIQCQNDEMHMMFHDVKNHFLTILGMETVADVDCYINEVMGNIQKYNIVQRTNNKLLDIILSKYDMMCKNNNIEFCIEVKTSNLNYLSEADLSAIINNLMDNAVEAAMQSKDRVIDFSLMRVNGFDVLKISNSCDREPLCSDNVLITTKHSKNMHGLGTKIIKKYVDKNDACYEWSYDEEKRRFNTSVIFHV